MRRTVPITDSSSDPAHPRRLEKKMNIADGQR
jgi:hypothetical protein